MNLVDRVLEKLVWLPAAIAGAMLAPVRRGDGGNAIGEIALVVVCALAAAGAGVAMLLVGHVDGARIGIVTGAFAMAAATLRLWWARGVGGA